MNNNISKKMIGSMLDKIQQNESTIEVVNDLVCSTFNNYKSAQLYMNYYCPINDNIKIESFEKSIDIIWANYDTYEKILICKNLNLFLEKIKKTDPKFCETVKSLYINLFIGFGTCDAFPYIEKDCAYVNIALEKLIIKENFLDSFHDLISHELTHIIRMKLGVYSSNRLIECLIEEGLACYFNKYIMSVKNEDCQRLFPVGLDTIDNFNMENIYKDYILKFDSSDYKLISEFMNFGNVNIVPGMGYIVGTYFIEKVLDENNINFLILLMYDNKKIENYILEVLK